MDTTTRQMNTTRECVPPGGKACTINIMVKALLALTISLAWGTQASAVPITNGSFETGDFFGWATEGNRSVVDADFGIVPVHGTYQALISNAEGQSGSSPITEDDLEEFLELNHTLQDAGPGSGIKTETTFSGTEGQVLSFYWNFLTTELNNEPDFIFEDFAFLALNGQATILADPLSPISFTQLPSGVAALSNAGYPTYATGYRLFSMILPYTGEHTLGFGIVQFVDQAFPSALLVDNISLTDGPISVPEPSSVVLLLLGLAGLVWWRRSKVASV